jgi:hypothetical protein
LANLDGEAGDWDSIAVARSEAGANVEIPLMNRTENYAPDEFAANEGRIGVGTQIFHGVDFAGDDEDRDADAGAPDSEALIQGNFRQCRNALEGQL